jgi:hypothetical protein
MATKQQWKMTKGTENLLAHHEFRKSVRKARNNSGMRKRSAKQNQRE